VFEKPEQFAGDVALEAALDFPRGFALGCASLNVGPGVGVIAGPG
jgi:hypothetical protein